MIGKLKKNKFLSLTTLAAASMLSILATPHLQAEESLLPLGGDSSQGTLQGILDRVSTPRSVVLTARLSALNPRQTLSGRQSGTAVIRISGDHITVRIHAVGMDPSIMHMAHIHKGNRCPSQVREDANHDGVLDVIEGLPAYGPVLVNFGADISSLAASAMGGVPMANASGIVNYAGAGSYSSLVADLHNRVAKDPATGIAKLAAGEIFKPQMGVIVVHGIRASKMLPAGTKTLKGSSPQMSLPVLCGRLHRVRNHLQIFSIE